MRIGRIGLLGLFPAATLIAQAPYNYDENCQTWPAVHGPFAVGTTDFELTDSLRSAQYAPAGTRSDIYRIIAPGLLHESWTDNSAIIGDTAMRNRLGDPAAIRQVLDLQRDLVLPFLDRYVKNRANGFPRSVLKRHPQLIVRNRFDIRGRR